MGARALAKDDIVILVASGTFLVCRVSTCEYGILEVRIKAVALSPAFLQAIDPSNAWLRRGSGLIDQTVCVSFRSTSGQIAMFPDSLPSPEAVCTIASYRFVARFRWIPVDGE